VGTDAGGTMTNLSSPWGLAIAPSSFGTLSGALLVGNFGDGRISAYNLTTGALLGQLPNSTGTAPISIPGLWALTPGNGGTGGVPTTLYFTAGIGDAPTFTNNIESHGLFGALDVAP